MNPVKNDNKPGKSVKIRFYAELNDFLSGTEKQKPFCFPFKGIMTVREAIESLGVPHSGVDLVLVNGEPAELTQRIQADDYISVYPEFEAFDISDVSRIRKKPLRTSRFIVDAHMGKLSRDLRMLGFDTLFAGTVSDAEIIETAAREKRVILTRDRDLLKSGKVDHGYYVRAVRRHDQLKEVINKFDLRSQFDPFTRCMVCNGILTDASLSEIAGRLNPELTNMYMSFFRCSGCGRIYWEGSHYARMMAKIEHLSEYF